jgi:hypothetical protein
MTTTLTPTAADFKALAVSVIYIQIADAMIFRCHLRPSGEVMIGSLKPGELETAAAVMLGSRGMWGDRSEGGFHVQGDIAARWFPKDPGELTTEWGVKHAAPGHGYTGKEYIEAFGSEDEAVECVEGQNLTRAVIVSRQVTQWTEVDS